MFDFDTWHANYIEQKQKDVASARLNKDGWCYSKRGRIVVTCPTCGKKAGDQPDLSEGPMDRLEFECDCGAIIRLSLTWEIEPVLVGVQIETGGNHD